MKESEEESAKAERKLPRRRLYQDVKFTHLLHTADNFLAHEASVESRHAPKSRSRRRHTATGTGGLTLKDIEEWVSSNERETAKVTKDDGVILKAKTNIVRMKSAVTKSSLDWQERRKSIQLSKEKGDYLVTLQRRHSASSSYDLLHQNGESTKTFGSVQTILKSITFADPASKAVENVKGGEKVLKNGLNNRLNCFLTPRPYKKDKTAGWNAMYGEERNCNGNGSTWKNDAKPPPSANGINGNTSTKDFASYSNYISDDDDEYMWRLRTHNGPDRGQAKYDTFLDLSNLDLDDNNASSDSSAASVSDSEAANIDCLKAETTESIMNSPGISGSRSLEISNGASEYVSILSSRDPLDRIDEDPTEDDCLDNCFKNDKNETATESASASRSDVTDFHGNSVKNPDVEFGERKQEFFLAEQNGISSASVNIRKEESDSKLFSGKEIPCAAVPSSTDGVASHSPLNNNHLQKEIISDEIFNSSTASTTTLSSCESVDGSKDSGKSRLEELDSCPLGDKTASLDRNQFQNLARSKSESDDWNSPSFKKRSLSQIDATSTENNKTSSHISLKRLLQMVLSTVGRNRSKAKLKDLLEFIESKGIKLTDPRLDGIAEKVKNESNELNTLLTLDTLSRTCQSCSGFIRSLLLSQVTVPGFTLFKLQMSRIFENVQQIVDKENEPPPSCDLYSNYNAIMRKLRSDKPHLSMAVCTVDGQRCSFGEESPHPLNTCATVFNYCLACRQNGIEATSYFLGDQLKPQNKSEFSIEPNEKVWNPFTKCGSILTSALLFREMATEDKLQALHKYYQTLIGQEPLCCDNLSYNYKRVYDHEEIGLAYFLSAHQRLPKSTSSDMTSFLDFHFQTASSAMTADACSVGAATLANNGVCPITDSFCIDGAIANRTVSVMRSSCGLPNLRENSDVAAAWNEDGSLIIIIPGVLGLVCYLQSQSTRTVRKVIEYLVKDILSSFNFDVYRSLRDKRNHVAKK